MWKRWTLFPQWKKAGSSSATCHSGEWCARLFRDHRPLAQSEALRFGGLLIP
jgi:hypothetical protein